MKIPAIAMLTRRHDEDGFLCRVMYETTKISMFDGKPKAMASERSRNRDQMSSLTYLKLAESKG